MTLPEDRLLIETDAPYQLDAVDFASRMQNVSSKGKLELITENAQEKQSQPEFPFLENTNKKVALKLLNQPGYVRENLKKVSALRGKTDSTKYMAEVLFRNTLRALGKLAK